LFLAFRAFPTVLATGVDSAGKQVAAFSDAQGRGDLVGIAAAVVQILILFLQVAGLALVIVNVLRAVFGGLWRWGKGSPARRVGSLAASAAMVAFLAYLWAPALPNNYVGPLYADARWQPIPPDAR